MAEGEFTNLPERITALERTIERLTAQVGADRGGQQQAVTHAEYDNLVAEQRQYIERVEQQVRGLQGTIAQFVEIVKNDATLFTAFTQAGMQISNTAIVSMASSKLTGDVAQAQLTTNVLGALNAASGNIDTDLLQTNLPAAFNASAGGMNFAQLNTGNISTAGTLAAGATTITGAASVSTALTIGTTLDHDGSAAGFMGSAPATQRTAQAVTNNLTANGTPDTFANYTPSGVYLTDQQAVYDAIANVARKLTQLVDGVRTFGLFGG